MCIIIYAACILLHAFLGGSGISGLAGQQPAVPPSLVHFLIISCYFLALNRTDAKDTDIEMLRDIIVDSLFSVLVSLGLSSALICTFEQYVFNNRMHFIWFP